MLQSLMFLMWYCQETRNLCLMEIEIKNHRDRECSISARSEMMKKLLFFHCRKASILLVFLGKLFASVFPP